CRESPSPRAALGQQLHCALFQTSLETSSRARPVRTFARSSTEVTCFLGAALAAVVRLRNPDRLTLTPIQKAKVGWPHSNHWPFRTQRRQGALRHKPCARWTSAPCALSLTLLLGLDSQRFP